MKKRTKTALLAFLAASALATSAVHAATVMVQNPVPYSEDSVVADNIRRECTIGTQLAESLQKHAAASGNEIVLGADTPDPRGSEVLKLEIVDALSQGNAFIGHHKSVSVKGKLYAGGKQVAVVMARRNTTGGFGAGFKGSCTVLNRAAEAIGNDLARWLVKPVDGARLGDL